MGVWAPFDNAELALLYPDHAAYVDRVKAVVAASALSLEVTNVILGILAI